MLHIDTGIDLVLFQCDDMVPAEMRVGCRQLKSILLQDKRLRRAVRSGNNWHVVCFYAKR